MSVSTEGDAERDVLLVGNVPKSERFCGRTVAVAVDVIVALAEPCCVSRLREV